MGCSPFGKLSSMVFGGRGKRPRGETSHREYTPQRFASQSMMRTVIYRDDGPVVVAQPVHPPTVQSPADNQQLHHPMPEADIQPSPHARAAEVQESGAEAVVYAVRGDAGYQTQFPESQAATATAAAVYRYVTSSVQDYGERRREYFGGEYRYSYPTPMREGIYRMATDANRLTTMFSDENPNACSIA